MAKTEEKNECMMDEIDETKEMLEAIYEAEFEEAKQCFTRTGRNIYKCDGCIIIDTCQMLESTSYI